MSRGLSQLLTEAGIDPDEVDLQVLQEQLAAVFEVGPEALDKFAELHEGDLADSIHQVEDSRFAGETLIALGELRYLGYDTNKGGEDATYHHDFADPPLLCIDPDRKLAVIGGTYRVNKRGIVG